MQPEPRGFGILGARASREAATLHGALPLRCVLLAALFVVCGSVAHGQMPSESLVVTLGPEFARTPEGIQLGAGFRFKRGDDPKWADPAFDDSGWEGLPDSILNNEPVKAALAKREVEFVSRGGDVLTPDWNGIGWFRLRIHADPALADTPLSLELTQAGASEIYVDGVLVVRYGQVASQSEKERAYDPVGLPAVFRLGRGGEHLLAVRYSCTAVPDLARGLIDLPEIQPRGAGFVAWIRPAGIAPHSDSERTVTAGAFGVIAGLLVGLALAHAFAGRSLPDSRAHRLLSLFCACACALVLVRLRIDLGRVGAGEHAYLSLAYYVLGVGSLLSYAAFMQEALLVERSRVYAVIVGFVAILSAAVAVAPEIAKVYVFGVLAACAFAYVWMAILIYQGRELRVERWWLFALALGVWFLLPFRQLFELAFDVSPVTSAAYAPAVLAFVAVTASLFLIRALASNHLAIEEDLDALEKRFKKAFTSSEGEPKEARER